MEVSRLVSRIGDLFVCFLIFFIFILLVGYTLFLSLVTLVVMLIVLFFYSLVKRENSSSNYQTKEACLNIENVDYLGWWTHVEVYPPP